MSILFYAAAGFSVALGTRMKIQSYWSRNCYEDMDVVEEVFAAWVSLFAGVFWPLTVVLGVLLFSGRRCRDE